MAFFLLLNFIIAEWRNIVKCFCEIFWLFCNAVYCFIEQSCIDIQILSSLTSLTHYGGGPAPIFYGAGYVLQGTWWKLGFIVTVCNLLIWLGLGSIWWHAIGLF